MPEQGRTLRERDPMGKAALFSGAPARQNSLGTLTLECSECRKESPVRLLEVPKLMFPFTLTLPRKYHTFLTCPACGRRAWMRAHRRL